MRWGRKDCLVYKFDQTILLGHGYLWLAFAMVGWYALVPRSLLSWKALYPSCKVGYDFFFTVSKSLIQPWFPANFPPIDAYSKNHGCIHCTMYWLRSCMGIVFPCGKVRGCSMRMHGLSAYFCLWYPWIQSRNSTWQLSMIQWISAAFKFSIAYA